MNISLQGKRVFITAGGAGMGYSTARMMHSLGAQVFTCDVDAQALSKLPKGISSAVCDVANSEELDRIFDKFLPDGLDILVNNAGVSGPTSAVEDISDRQWQHCMEVCINAQFYCARRVVPVFKRQQAGVIINMISAAGIMGYPNRSPYVAAKWAVSGFTKTLAMELGSHNIRVNGIVPGNVEGDRMERIIQAHALKDGLDLEQVRKNYAIGTSMRCYVDPDEIANLICYLCSEHGRHISGQIIGVDGHTETLYPRSLE